MSGAEPGRNPYVGPRPYETAEEHLFFGRDREAEELVSLVLANPVTVFYSESGAGKTSLLRARLVPCLKREQMEVLPIARVSGPPPPRVKKSAIVNIFAFNTLLSWAPQQRRRELLSMTLARYLEQQPRRTDEAGAVGLRVAIFDQFEELFSRHQDRWRDRAGFFEQVAEALKDPALRVIFALREDFLGRLEPYSALPPGRLRARFRMERLCEEAALRAVKGPLEGSGREFDRGVAERLVEELLHTRVESETGETIKVKGDVVEPVQLQVVCHRLWESLPPRVRRITEQHRRKFGNVDLALSSFYAGAIAAASEASGIHPHYLREWCEAQLITTTGTRGFVHRGPAATAGLPNAAAEALEAARLIRSEWRAGARWYELTHDRFIGPIQASNEEWRRERSEKLRQALGRLRKAEQLAQKGSYADAVERATEALALSEESAEIGSVLLALNLLGGLHAARKDYVAALESFYRLGRLAEQSGQRDEALACLLAIGQVFREMGRLEEAAATLSRYVELSPDDPGGYAERAATYWMSGQHQAAVEDYRRAIRLDPDNAILRNELGNVYRALGRTDKAIAAYQEAIRLDENFGSPHYNLGIVYAAMGLTDEARREYELAIQLDPRDAYSHEGLGDLYARIGRTEDAIAFFRRAIEINPSDPSAHTSLAYVYRDVGRYEEALANFRRAIDLNPRDASPYVGMGGTYRRTGRLEEAIAAYERAIEVEPNNVLARASQAACYRKLGREKEYREAAERARREATPEWEAEAGEYNQACFYALVGDTDSALGRLRAALKKKQQAPDFAWRDIDFEFIRDDPRFGALVGRPN